MCGRRSTPFLLLLTFLAAFFALSSWGGPVAVAQVFSVDPASPLAALGSPANLYTPGPALYAPAGSIGLLAGDDIDAFSFGFDRVGSAPLYFSLNFFATGAPATAVCSQAGFCGPAVPCAPEQVGDIFSSAGGGTNALLFDGDGVPVPPGLGLTECPAAGPKDNVDAFDDLVAPLIGTNPTWRVYFSLSPGSPTLGGGNPLLPGGAGPADILVYDSGQNSLTVFFSAAGMGLVAGDNIDGISFNVLTSDFLFSLAPGSPSLGSVPICGGGGCTPGDFIRSAGPCCGGTPCLFCGPPGGFAGVGLGAGDNVDAVDEPGLAPGFVSPADDTSPGKTFSLDPSSPSLAAIRTNAPVRPGSPADLLTQDRARVTSAPRVAFRAESLGLLPGDDIDGLSFGTDPVYAGGNYDVEFSVDRFAGGAGGSAVSTETGAVTGREASADIFEAFMPAGSPPVFVGNNTQSWDGNGSTAPDNHLRDVPLNLPINDHVDALEGPPRVVDPNNDGVRDLPVYFSLAPGSPTLAAIGASPGDILVCAAPACPVPAVFITDVVLGLAAGENLEDFSLNASTGNVDFTLPAGSPTLFAIGSSPGAILKRAGFPPCGAIPCTIFFPAAVGLLAAGDDMEALDALDPVQVCVRIAAGPDPTIGVFHGACPGAVAAGPYDVIEGEMGELTQVPGNLNLSRVFCRADDLSFDNITLSTGMDPFTRARFILARNGGGVQVDYGFSSAGNPRNPSYGGCP